MSRVGNAAGVFTLADLQILFRAGTVLMGSKKYTVAGKSGRPPES
jgi:hypothetical protein